MLAIINNYFYRAKCNFGASSVKFNRDPLGSAQLQPRNNDSKDMDGNNERGTRNTTLGAELNDPAKKPRRNRPD